MKIMSKLHPPHAPYPPYTPDPAAIDFFFISHKRICSGEKFKGNEEVIAESVAHFETEDKSFQKTIIEKLEDRYNRCIVLDRNYAE